MDINTFFKQVKEDDWLTSDATGESPLLFLLQNNQKMELNFSPKEIMEAVHKSDLLKVTAKKMSALTLIVRNNKTENLNLSPQQILSVAQKSNLKQLDMYKWSPLNYILSNNVKEELFLTSKEILNLALKSDLKVKNIQGNTLLMMLFILQKNHGGLVMDLEDIKAVMEHSDLNIKTAANENLLSFLFSSRNKEWSYKEKIQLTPILIQNGNDPDHKASFGKNAWEVAGMNGVNLKQELILLQKEKLLQTILPKDHLLNPMENKEEYQSSQNLAKAKKSVL